jgi:acyl-CoA thioester hydrolase
MPIEVRFRDLDGMGHVNNAVFFTYIEAARTEYLMKVMGAKRLEDVDWIVASATMSFRRPISYGDPVEVCVKPTKLGTTSFTLHYLIRDRRDQAVIAEGETVIVMFDYSKRMKKPITSEIRRTLERDSGE